MFCINFFGQQDDKGRVEKTEVSEITSPHSIDSSHDIILDCLPASLVEAPRESIWGFVIRQVLDGKEHLFL
jgi:hypothetical protein